MFVRLIAGKHGQAIFVQIGTRGASGARGFPFLFQDTAPEVPGVPA